MRSIRRWIRIWLTRLPGDVGEKVLLPRIRVLYDRMPFLTWRTRSYARNEAKRILTAISNGADTVTIVYDTKVAGLAFGSIVNFVALARCLIILQVRVRLLFVHTNRVVELNEEASQQEIDDFLTVSQEFSEKALESSQSDVQQVSSSDLEALLTAQAHQYILFEDFTRNRRPYFRDCFNVLNQLMDTIDEDLRSSAVYSPETFQSVLPKPFQDRSYITWACRYSPLGTDLGRQTYSREFSSIYEYLRRNFPKHSIVVVSDKIGCDHYAQLSESLNIDDLEFSKNYDTDFVSDAALVLSSDFFFSFRAGGIGQLALLSQVPFEIMSPVMNEIPWSNSSLTSWQTPEQSFVILNKHQFEKNREQDLDHLGSHPLTKRVLSD